MYEHNIGRMLAQSDPALIFALTVRARRDLACGCNLAGKERLLYTLVADRQSSPWLFIEPPRSVQLIRPAVHARQHLFSSLIIMDFQPMSETDGPGASDRSAQPRQVGRLISTNQRAQGYIE